MTRDELLNHVALGAARGQFGFFVGSGFSMEYTNDSAPSFEALLRGVAADLQVGFDFDDPAQIRGKSLSAIAADLEQARAEALAAEADIEEPPPRKAAHRELREAKRRRCNLSVDEDKRAHFQAAQARLLPSWVITTNYDLVLEQLLRRSISLGPTARVVARADAPPVLHLHGRITEPETIVVTDNDYVAALRPTSYAFFKLPVLLAESTTLLLGYGLGDVNVRQAAAWAASWPAERKRGREFEGLIVQALHDRTARPDTDPERGHDGEYVLRIASIPDLLDDLAERTAIVADIVAEVNARVEELTAEEQVGPFQDDAEQRTDLVRCVAQNHEYLDSDQVERFLTSALDPIWDKARADGGFDPLRSVP